jgi:peptidoglycan/xylan/chitin deacetylase (PgdA/CDA1 family)
MDHVKKFLCDTFSGVGVDRLVWRLDPKRLRILCYHGVCEDRFAGEPWVPEFFVTESAFRKQLQYLKTVANVLPLSEGVARLMDGTLDPRSVSITFDDGYANNLLLAQPILQEYNSPATIFLSSGYLESGELFPFLKLKLIRLHLGAAVASGDLIEYQSAPLDAVTERVDLLWTKVKARLTDEQRDALRPLTVPEVRLFDPNLIQLGAHSHTHCIFRNESRIRRNHEICTSIQRVAEWTGRPVQLFSYPNGQRGDFDDMDKQFLFAEGVRIAVSGIGGANASGSSDLLALRRYPVGIYHDDAAFRAEVTGFRASALAVIGRLRS